jgi:hypothetical protein
MQQPASLLSAVDAALKCDVHNLPACAEFATGAVTRGLDQAQLTRPAGAVTYDASSIARALETCAGGESGADQPMP